MSSDKHGHKLSGETRASHDTTPTRGTGRLSDSAGELAAISPLLQDLARQKPPEVSARHWREFSLELSTKLDQEIQGKSSRRITEKIRDQLSATDSTILRATVVFGALFVLAFMALCIWIAATASGQAFWDDATAPLLSSGIGSLSSILAA